MAAARLFWLVLLTVLSTSTAATAQDGSEYRERIEAFLSRPDQMKLQTTAVGQAWGSAAGPCGEIKIAKMGITFLRPITFDDGGTPLSGSWKHTIVAEGCDKSRTLNLFYVAEGSGNVKRIAGAPGSSATDLTLQHDSIPYVLAGALPVISRDCKQIQLIDTAYVGTEGDPIPGGKVSPWREDWTLSGCGSGARVTMHFAPDATGTKISVKPEETKRVDVH
jgi:hypothetical protein